MSRLLTRVTRIQLPVVLLLLIITFEVLLMSYVFTNQPLPFFKQESITDPAIALKHAIKIEAQTMADVCKQTLRDWRSCYMTEFSKLTKIHPASYSIQVLNKLEKIDTKAQDCHMMAHVISSIEVGKDTTKWKDFIASVPANYCTGGFIHGSIEALSNTDATFSFNAHVVDQVCSIIKRSVKGGGGDQYCAHIMGHVLLAEEKGEIDRAVEICKYVQPSIQYQCYGGLFMENITRDNLVAHGVGEKIPTNQATTDAQEILCKNHTGLTATGCWREISHMYVVLAKNDPQLAFNYCSRANTLKDRDECYLHAIGLITREPTATLVVKKEVCDPYSDNPLMSRRCITEVVSTFLYSSKSFKPQVEEFCGSLETEYQSFCQAQLAQRLQETASPQDD